MSGKIDEEEEIAGDVTESSEKKEHGEVTSDLCTV
jgi:hypothetical protein